MKPTIGVIIPVYERRLEVAAALKSVFAQTRQPDQIIVIDDGSYPPLDMRDANGIGSIELLRLDRNAGPAAARRAGIERLSTTHVAFLDADDTWLPDKLERQIAFLNTVGAGANTAIGCGWTWVSEGGDALQSMLPKASARLSDFASGCWFCPGSTVLMRRDDIIRIGGFDRRLRRLEDLDLFLRFAGGGGRLAVAPFIGARIRRGHNARLRDVKNAARSIRDKYAMQNSFVTRAGLAGRLESWLSLEEAAAARNERRWGEMLKHLALSIYRRPRPRLHLETWWTPLATPAAK